MPHLNEKLDFVSDVFIVHENKVLLRKHDKYKIWLSVGGHIELGEDPTEAAIREAKEEVGLDVTLVGNVVAVGDLKRGKELLVPRFINRHWVNDTHEHVSFIYVCHNSEYGYSSGRNRNHTLMIEIGHKIG